MTALVNLILSAILGWFTDAVTVSVNDFLAALFGASL